MNDRWRERDRWGARGPDDDEDEYRRRREAWRESDDFWANDTGRRDQPRYGAGNRGWGNEYSTDWRRYADRNPGSRREWGGDYDRGYGRSSETRWGEDRYGGRDHERGWWDRTKDEVRSWMGDSDAEHRREADREYGHRGRGPKGYTRSDERIREDVNDRLMEDWGVDATDIEVTVNAGEVTLTGTVDSRESKRRAEDIAAYVLGVKDVQNSLRVRRTDPLATSRDVGTGSTTTPLSTGSSISPTPRSDRH